MAISTGNQQESVGDGLDISRKHECPVKKNVGFKLPKHGHLEPKRGGVSLRQENFGFHQRKNVMNKKTRSTYTFR